MINIILVGSGGKMGKFVANGVQNDSSLKIVAGVDKFNNGESFPVFSSFDEINVDADLIIDFSNPSLLDGMLDFALKNKTALVIATTGYSEEQIEKIKEASKVIPVFFTFNMSLGVNLICSLATKAASILGDGFDVEIIEKHHNQKIDAPSGTALMLANAVRDARGGELNIGRSDNGKRKDGEIGIHSLRTGAVIGEHEVRIDTGSETITLKHQSHGRELFGEGALCAASFISVLDSGFYTISDMIGRKC